MIMYDERNATSFGMIPKDDLMELLSGYPVTLQDIKQLDQWFLGEITDFCSWTPVLDQLPYFLPHLHHSSGVDFAARLSMLCWLERHAGFNRARDYPISFFEQVNGVLAAVAVLDWEDAYRVLSTITKYYDDTPITMTEHVRWFTEAAKYVKKNGIQLVEAHTELFMRGYSAEFLDGILGNDIDDELIRSLLLK